MSDDRRRFSRIPFDAPVRLHQNDWHAATKLLDISLQGALIQQPDNWEQADATQPFQLVIELSELEHIHMEAEQSFARDGLLGMKCHHMDLDSISHLKRLVLLNLGDEELAERELAALCR